MQNLIDQKMKELNIKLCEAVLHLILEQKQHWTA